LHGQGDALFKAYGDDYIQFGKTKHSSLLLNKGVVLASPWQVNSLQQLCAHDFAVFADDTPEVLLIGTGRRTCFPSQDVYAELQTLPYPIEYMGTHAAARTYNLLLGEGRNIAIALFSPSS